MRCRLAAWHSHPPDHPPSRHPAWSYRCPRQTGTAKNQALRVQGRSSTEADRCRRAGCRAVQIQARLRLLQKTRLVLHRRYRPMPQPLGRSQMQCRPAGTSVLPASHRPPEGRAHRRAFGQVRPWRHLLASYRRGAAPMHRRMLLRDRSMAPYQSLAARMRRPVWSRHPRQCRLSASLQPPAGRILRRGPEQVRRRSHSPASYRMGAGPMRRQVQLQALQ